MKKVTIKEYATKHKLSMFNVVKMVKSGKLKTQTTTTDAKESIYIIFDDDIEKEVKEKIIPNNKDENRDEDNSSLESIVLSLREEVKLLREDIDRLIKELH